MNIQYNNINTIKNSQQGAVLIVVLMSLVLISIAGIMSVKNSNADLRVATSDQVNTVLLQSADNINNKLEQTVNAKKDDTAGGGAEWAAYNALISEPTGALAHFLLDSSGLTDNDIAAFCYRPTQANFVTENAVIKRNGGNVKSSANGYCDPSNADHYTASRGSTMTQLVIDKVPNPDKTTPMSHLLQGSDASEDNLVATFFDFHTTSILPALGSASIAEIKGCIAKSTDVVTASSASNENAVDKGAMMACMRSKDIVTKQLVENILLKPTSTEEFCTYQGGVNGADNFCGRL